jgi:hypothetical protein
LPEVTDFHVVSGGDHPTIGWSNDDTNATQYRIRVLNPATSALYYEVDLNRVELGSNPVYTFSEFNFMPGVTYDLRIETRQYVDSNIYSNPAGSYIRPQVLNRSTYFASYTNTDSSAYAHSWTLIVSDNRTTGWRLFTDIGINGVLGTPQGAYGSTSETLGAFQPMQPWAVWTPPNTPEFYSQDLSGQPSDHNGFTFAWEWSDSKGSYRQTAVATGIRRVQVSYDFHVVADGAHPTIGWSNDDTNVTQYRIRVLNPSSDALLYEANLDYAQFGAHPVYNPHSGKIFHESLFYKGSRLFVRQVWSQKYRDIPINKSR